MINDVQLLSFILDNGIIRRDAIEQVTQMKEQELYLTYHKYKVWYGKDGYWKTKICSNGKLKLIKKKRMEDLKAYLNSLYADQVDHSFKAIFFDWVKRQELCGRSSNTIIKYISDYNRFFANYAIENINIRDISDTILSEHISSVLKDHPIRWRALLNIWGYLNGMFEKCIRDRVIFSNPCNFVDLELFKKNCQETTFRTVQDRTLTNEEQSILKEKLINPGTNNSNQIAAFAIELALYTGMRVGELVALSWDDIVPSEGIILIRHSEKYDRSTKTYSISTTKNNKIRYFPLTTNIVDLLERVESYERHHEWFGDYIFMDSKGRIHANVVSSSIRNRTMNGSFSTPKSIHSIRRTFNSNLRKNGVSNVVAASLLGHTPEVNDGNYTYDVETLNNKKKYVTDACKI